MSGAGGPVGIVPAAGQGVRLQPLPCSKEALPIGGRAVMHYVLDRMDDAGVAGVRVVTRREKRDVVAIARARGATVVFGRPPTLGASIELAIDGVDDDVVVVLGYPDSVFQPPDGFARTLALLERSGADAALGLFRVADPARSDVVTIDEDGRVVRIDIKPEVPTTDWIWGCLAAPARLLRGIGDDEWPSAHVAALARRGHVAAERLSEIYLDVGTPSALAEAEGFVARHGLVA